MPLPFYSQTPLWKAFFPDKKEVRFLEKTIEEEWISSGSTKIHLDIYPVSKKAPTIIYSHGLSSCGRMRAV
jgi:hypothetical protein